MTGWRTQLQSGEDIDHRHGRKIILLGGRQYHRIAFRRYGRGVVPRPYLVGSRAASATSRQVLLRTLAKVAPVVGEHLPRPRGLDDRAAREELSEDKHQFDDRCACVGIKVGDVDVEAVDPQDRREGDAETCRAPVVVVGELPSRGPCRVVAGAARVERDVVGRALAEMPYALEVAEFVDALQGLLRKLRVEAGDRLDAALEVIEAPGVAVDDPS